MRNKKLIVALIVVCSIALLVVLNSVIFSVQNVTAYCMNEDDDGLSEIVIESSGIKKGGSIFTLKKSKIIDSVTKNVPNVKVINVEKFFPNTVSINYVKIFPYLRIEKDGKYYFCGNDGKIIHVDTVKNPIGVEAKEKGFNENGDIIELRLSQPIGDVKEGGTFASPAMNEVQLVTELLSALERLQIYGDAVEIIDFIDISKSQYVFVGMHSGVVLELQGGSNITSKLRAALTFYSVMDEKQRSEGTFIIPDGDGSGGSYSPQDRYSLIMGKE